MMKTSPRKMENDKVHEFLKTLGSAGITIDDCLAAISASKNGKSALHDAFKANTRSQRIIYERELVESTLELTSNCHPDFFRMTPTIPRKGEMLIYYGGWSFDDLRASTYGQQFIHPTGPGIHLNIAPLGYYLLIRKVQQQFRSSRFFELLNRGFSVGICPGLVGLTAELMHTAKTDATFLGTQGNMFADTSHIRDKTLLIKWLDRTCHLTTTTLSPDDPQNTCLEAFYFEDPTVDV